MAARKLKKSPRAVENLDPTPIEVPLAFKRPMTLAEQVRQMVRSEELRRAALQAGMETFEEADDFDVGDDYDPRSPYEMHFDHPLEPSSAAEGASQEGAKAPAAAAPSGGDPRKQKKPAKTDKKSPPPADDDEDDAQ